MKLFTRIWAFILSLFRSESSTGKSEKESYQKKEYAYDRLNKLRGGKILGRSNKRVLIFDKSISRIHAIPSERAVFATKKELVKECRPNRAAELGKVKPIPGQFTYNQNPDL